MAFNIPQIRQNLAAQLYVYAKTYDTDNEWMSKKRQLRYVEEVDMKMHLKR